MSENAAATAVGIGADDRNIAMRRIGCDGGSLIFNGILFVIGGHPHILRGPETLRTVIVSGALFALHRTDSPIDKAAFWLSFRFLRIPNK
jgi:hypothetical protein